ncbi:uncharacterized protein [Amphiura filiformis]|uniref:uncharacterized protein n=1 Tax=Amphiura filiformis TaxID=82378 RepID=UPI003B2113D1
MAVAWWTYQLLVVFICGSLLFQLSRSAAISNRGDRIRQQSIFDLSRPGTIDTELNTDVNSLQLVIQRIVQRIEDLDELRRSFENAASRISKRPDCRVWKLLC